MQTQGLMVQRIKKARSFSVDERKGGGGWGVPSLTLHLSKTAGSPEGN